MLPAKDLTKSWPFRIFMCFLDVLMTIFPLYNVVIAGESIPEEAVMLVSSHSSHNMELLFIAKAIYEKTGRPVRGLGHYMMYIMLPHFKAFGMEIACPTNVDTLLAWGEIVCILPGGQEEMLRIYPMVDYHWKSLSGNYRLGFARHAVKNKAWVQPIVVKNVENMGYAPLSKLFELLGLYGLLRILVGCNKWYSRIMTYILMLLLVIGQTLVIPKRTCLIVEFKKANKYDSIYECASECHASIF